MSRANFSSFLTQSPFEYSTQCPVLQGFSTLTIGNISYSWTYLSCKDYSLYSFQVVLSTASWCFLHTRELISTQLKILGTPSQLYRALELSSSPVISCLVLFRIPWLPQTTNFVSQFIKNTGLCLC